MNSKELKAYAKGLAEGEASPEKQLQKILKAIKDLTDDVQLPYFVDRYPYPCPYPTYWTSTSASNFTVGEPYTVPVTPEITWGNTA